MSTEGALLGVGAAALAAFALPRRPGTLALLLCLPVAAVLLDPVVRIVSHHGFFHADIVYRILEVGLPPEDPHLAGAPLHYPWAGHALVAGLCRALGVVPGTGFALLNLAALLATTLLLFGVARELTGDGTAAALGVVMALYGYSLFAGGPAAQALSQLLDFAPEARATPIQKFGNVNHNGLGILGFALFLRAALGLARNASGWRPLLLLFAATLWCAVLYPLLWVAVGASAAATVVALGLLGRPRLPARRGVAALAALALASAAALPYLLQIQLGRSPEVAPRIVLAPAHLGRNGANLALALAGLALIAFLGRSALVRRLERSRGAVLAVGASAVATAALFLLVGAPLAVEYKYLALCGLCCALLAGAPLAALRERRRVTFVLSLGLLLTPMGAHFAKLGQRGGAVAVEGADLRHPDPRQAALHRWLREHTPADAVFVDTELSLPTYARRSLFVALDPGRGWTEQFSTRRGWRIPPSAYLTRVVGHDPGVVALRAQTTRILLDPDLPGIPEGAFSVLARAAGGSPVYVLAREPRSARRLAADARFERLAEPGGVAVFRLRPAETPAASTGEPPVDTGRPHVVVVVADDLGWGDVGYHGGLARTPNLDRLAAQGLELDRFYAFPLCTPTRVALMSGRSPIDLGLVTPLRPWVEEGLPAEASLLARRFRDAGYQTAAVGKWHLGHSGRRFHPRAHGFEHFFGFVNGAIDHYRHTRLGRRDWQRNGETVVQEGYATDLLADEAVRVIRERDRSRRLFLYVPLPAPHMPLQAPAEQIRRYAGVEDPKRRVYAAMVDSLDRALGRILAVLAAEGLTDETLVAFLSDNGALPVHASNRPLRGGKSTVFEGGIRVPAVLHWPAGLDGGRRSSQVLTVMDLLPTLAGAAGIGEPGDRDLDGRDLWAALTGDAPVAREDLCFAVEYRDTAKAALLRGDWKLVRERDRAAGTESRLLFDLSRDPTESRDLSAQHPEVVEAALAGLADCLAGRPDSELRDTLDRPPGWEPPADWARHSAR